LELAPSQPDFREKMQKIKGLMSELESLDAEARFAEGPHKVLLEDCIMKRDLEIDSERIGAGGSSEVFRAVWKDRIVAVKMPPKGLKIDLAVIKDLQLEMRRMQNCSHRNVVVCHGLMVEPCSPTSAGIVMELCSGTLLDLFIESKEPPWKKRLSAALDTARGLEYLHSRSIIHRDVKPQNLLIAAGGVIKVRIGTFIICQCK
jgi:fused-like protein